MHRSADMRIVRRMKHVRQGKRRAVADLWPVDRGEGVMCQLLEMCSNHSEEQRRTIRGNVDQSRQQRVARHHTMFASLTAPAKVFGAALRQHNTDETNSSKPHLFGTFGSHLSHFGCKGPHLATLTLMVFSIASSLELGLP